MENTRGESGADQYAHLSAIWQAWSKHIQAYTQRARALDADTRTDQPDAGGTEGEHTARIDGLGQIARSTVGGFTVGRPAVVLDRSADYDTVTLNKSSSRNGVTTTLCSRVDQPDCTVWNQSGIAGMSCSSICRSAS